MTATQLAHGYPVDRVRENPRICFTAVAEADPPLHALWGNTRSKPQRAQRKRERALALLHGDGKQRAERSARRGAARPRRAASEAALAATVRTMRPSNIRPAAARFNVNGTLESSGDPGRNPLTGLTLGGDHTGQFTLNGDVAACVLFRGVLPDDANASSRYTSVVRRRSRHRHRRSAVLGWESVAGV